MKKRLLFILFGLTVACVQSTLAQTPSVPEGNVEERLSQLEARVKALEEAQKGVESHLTADEQALVEKGAYVEMYEPDEPSRHYIGKITKHGSKNSPVDTVLIFVFGIEDAAAARSEGRSMAEAHYSRAMAEQFLFAEGWDKYHDRFFTRAYVQEGVDAYQRALK